MVYPNSTKGDCWITIDVVSKQAIDLHVVDALGKLIRHWNVSVTPKMQPIRVSLPDVNGWYFLRVETEKGSVVKKVLRVN
ncbi:T9SS type A sorting domain-containing protein [Spirosoma areae]